MTIFGLTIILLSSIFFGSTLFYENQAALNNFYDSQRPSSLSNTLPFGEPSDINEFDIDANYAEDYSILRLEIPYSGSSLDKYPVRGTFAIDLWPGIYYNEDIALYKPRIEELHARGIKYMIYRNLQELTDVNYTYFHEYYPDFTPENASFINLDGDAYIIDHDSYGTPIFRLSTNRPYWRDLLINLTKLAIDAGADAVVFDVGFGHYPPNEWNFDNDSIRGFRAYLDQKYNSDYLQSEFNISDISTFDFGEYLRSLGYDANSLASDLQNGQSLGTYADRLWVEWKSYHLEVLVDYYQRLYTELKDYARSLGKEFYIFSNIYSGLDPTYNILYLLNYTDGLFAEIFFDDFDYPRYSPTYVYKLVHDFGKHYIPMTSPLKNSSLYSLHIAEVFASGNWATLSEEQLNYFMFVNTHSYLFDKELDSEVGLVYSLASKDNYKSFLGAYNLLMHSQKTTDVLVFGDNKWINDTLTLQQLTKYKMIVLPATANLTEHQVDLLLNYTKLGGVLVGFGEVGKYNETGDEPNTPLRNEFTSLFNESTVAYGNGTVTSWINDIGTNYYDTYDNTILADFQARLSTVSLPEIVSTFGNNVTFYQYWDSGTSSMILHLLNYDYNNQSDTFTIHCNESLLITLAPDLVGKNLRVMYYTPDTYFNGTELNYTIEQETSINITIPELSVWGILKIEVAKGEQQDLEITSPTTLVNTHLIVNGNVLVKSKLVLENVTVEFNGTLNNILRLEVYDGAELIIKNSTICPHTSETSYYVKIDKGSKLYIESTAFVDVGAFGPVYMGGIWINTNDVLIINSTISGNYYYGVHIYNASYVKIINSVIYNTLVGVEVLNSTFIELANCVLYNNSIGVSEILSSHVTIKNSNIYLNRYFGVVIHESLFSTIAESTIYNSVYDGIISWDSFFVKVTNSTIYSNENGINARCTPILTVSNSKIYNNTEAGLRLYKLNLLYQSRYKLLDSLTTIIANEIHNNTYGIIITDSNKLKISMCDIYNNLWGVYFDKQSTFVFLLLSNFMDNTKHIYIDPLTQGNIQFDNTTHGNYWDNHTSPDNNADGIVDTAYVIDQSDADYKPLAQPLPKMEIDDLQGPTIYDVNVTKDIGSDHYNMTISIKIRDETSISWVLANGTIFNLPNNRNIPQSDIMVYFYNPYATILGYDRSNWEMLPPEGYPVKGGTCQPLSFTFPLNYTPQLRIFAVDVYGNWAENDSVAPHIMYVNWFPENAEYDESVTVLSYVFDISDIKCSIVSYYDTESWTNTTMTFSDELDAFVGQIPPQKFNITVQFKLYVTDVFNNTAVSDIFSYYVYDSTPPILTIISPSSGDTVGENVNVSWTCTDDGSGIKEIVLYLNGTQIATLEPTTTSYLLTDLNLGDYNVTLVAIDYANNSAVATVVFSVLIDTTPPTLTITSPSNGSAINSPNVTINWECTDDISGIKEIKVYLNGTLVATLGPDAVNYTLTGLSFGSYNVTLVAYDNSNNEAIATVLFTVTFDDIPPTVSILSPQQGETVSGAVNISWTCNDEGSGVKEIVLYLNGTQIATLSPDVTSYILSDLVSATYNVTIVVYDNANNKASATVIFTHVVGGESTEEPESTNNTQNETGETTQPSLPFEVIVAGGISAVAIVLVVLVLRKKITRPT